LVEQKEMKYLVVLHNENTELLKACGGPTRARGPISKPDSKALSITSHASQLPLFRNHSPP